MKPTDLVRRADALLTEASGDPAAVEAPDLPLLRGERWAGAVLTRTVVALALLTVLGAAACAVLAPFALWQPVVALPVLLVLLAVSVRVSAIVPGRPLPVWSAATLVVLSVAATVWAGATHSEQLLPRRDSGSYYQASVNLAEHHRTPIPVPAATIGGPHVLDIPGVTLDSPAFYQTGTAAEPTVQPQFVIGPSAWYSVGYWLGGPGAMLWTPAVFGGLGVLALGLLVGTVVGPRWGPLGALGTVLCFPLLHVNRSTYSEPPAVLVLAAGLLVLAAATSRGERGAHRHARLLGVLAGVLIGGGGLIRIDALRETVLLLPVAALLMVRRNSAGAGLLWGAGAATVVTAAAALGLAYRYLGSIAASLVPLVLLGILLGLAAATVVLLARRGVGLPARVRDRLPTGRGAARPARRGRARDPAAVAHRAPVGGRPRLAPGRRPPAAAGAAGRRRPHLRRAVTGVDGLVDRAGGGGDRLRRPRLRRPPPRPRLGPRRPPARLDRAVPHRSGVGPAHVGAPGHHPGPPVGGPAPVHRPAVRRGLRGDGGGLAHPVVHAPDVTGRPRGRQRRHRLRAARARGDGDAAARAGAGRARLAGGHPRGLPGPRGPATWR